MPLRGRYIRALTPPCSVFTCGGAECDPCTYWDRLLDTADTYREALDAHAGRWGV